MKVDVIKSRTEPATNKLWLSPEGLKEYKSNGWELTTGNSNNSSASMINILWEDLKNLRDSALLIPGQQYRIIDYVATTLDPESRSANHPFDIIVTADDNKTLNENARAICHEGDTYFSKCKLESWKLKYCIDNDTTRWNWAQTEGMYSNIDMMADWGLLYNSICLESDNDTQYQGYPYLFFDKEENIKIYTQTLNSDVPTEGLIDFGYGSIHNTTVDSIKTNFIENGKGVIYQLIDENNNEMQYDFKGIQFKRYKIIYSYGPTSIIGAWGIKGTLMFETDIEDYCWCYLFSCIGSNDTIDMSVYQHNNNIYDIIVKNCISKTSGILQNGVCYIKEERLINKQRFYCESWTCDDECYNWTCENNCYNWTCGENCYDWFCVENCYGWTCGNDCYSWICGYGCYSWTCGNNCNNWTCGDYCRDWTCGENCHTWYCEDKCHAWTCGNNCFNWGCGNNCINFNILNGVYEPKPRKLPIIENANYTQYVGYATDGTLRVWNPADV